MLITLLDAAQKQLILQYEELRRLRAQESGTPIGEFLTRVLTWRTDPNRRHWLWELFNEAIDMSDVHFMGSLASFINNCLIDDHAFRVEYRKPFLKEEIIGTLPNGVPLKSFNLEWQTDGSFKTVLVEESDPKGSPVVVLDNDGTQDVRKLMRAMDRKEREHDERLALEAEKLELFRRIREGR